MPKISQRAQLLASCREMLNICALFNEVEEFDEIMEFMMLIESNRFLYARPQIPKTSANTDLLWLLPDLPFKQICRMNKETFNFVLSKISGHTIFESNSVRKQRDVRIKLMVTLERLGCDGNGSSVGRLARVAGIGAGTVTLYFNRVVTALLDIKKEFIKWPKRDERRRISNRCSSQYGIPGAVAIIDGTHVHFSQRPAVDGEVYSTRKCRYSLNAQIVCDFEKQIRYYQVGWPGSVFDQTAFAETKLFKSPDRFLSKGEFLLGDSGYAATCKMLTPYRNPLAQLPENARFNFQFSRARVCVEHVMGLLKSRWSYLRGIRTQLNKPEDLQVAFMVANQISSH